MKHINDNLRDILPQKEPFRFIDSVKKIDYNNSSITYLYSFKGDNPIFKGHFPGEPIVPGVLLYSSKIKFKPRQLHLAVPKYSLRLAS
ncbi:3-hydroxyacyl-ACP dehydratase FabZ family protein [Streptococcus pseudopneumoniae]|uniref:ApeI dehydratase-like domain-containing protein n=1 Tax=Streptococcus pseudopneumoniae TaxID=257758 RepID=A0A3A4NIF8_9STRE|nr:hypothetical protein [Streptococcus pseudopneumoniae]RJP14501.1 hypothetical protein C5O69_03190 [Streptococcus pseudopneumoniae]TMR86731.1 hypothetical protein E3V19_05355 [Streptococcus pseudopneumoniae]